MDATSRLVEGEEPRAVLLLVYTDRKQAAALVDALADGRYELLACPFSVLADTWLEDPQPDLVLLELPSDAAGLLQACEALRARTDRPIVALAAWSEELLVARAFAAGMDEYLVLPVGGRELRARIDAMVRRSQRDGAPREPSQVGGLTLSSRDLSVQLEGRKIFLTPIEFRLLSCLASAPGKVVTHDALMSRVWGAEYVDSRHYLHLYIRYLREKLEENPADPKLIVSEWGVGYRFQPPLPASR